MLFWELWQWLPEEVGEVDFLLKRSKEGGKCTLGGAGR